MKYYTVENVDRYAWVGTPRYGEVGASQCWRDGDPEGSDFENFQTRNFLEWAIGALGIGDRPLRILEYGCGTGAAACYLASRGHLVHAVDVIESAIVLARQIADERSLAVRFEVADICALPCDMGSFQLVIDSYCLQHIVFDQERDKLFAGVRSCLERGGSYLVSSVCLDEDHLKPIGDKVPELNHLPGRYRRYGSGIIEEVKGIVYENRRKFTGGSQCSSSISVGGEFYIPYRRYLSRDQLIAGIESHGFELIHVDDRFPESFVFRSV